MAISGALDHSTVDIDNSETVFNILRNRRRRYLIGLLTEADAGEIEIGTASEYIAAWENGVSVDAVSGSARKTVYTTLQQTHLPKMDGVGVIDYNSRSGVITKANRLDDVVVYMEVVEGNELPWQEYYTGLGAVMIASAAAIWVGVYPLTMIGPVIWMAVFAAILTASAVVQTVIGKRRGNTLTPDCAAGFDTDR